MKTLNYYDDLLGKTISSIHHSHGSDGHAVLFVTSDNEVMGLQADARDENEYEPSFEILKKGYIMNIVQNNDRLRKAFADLGLFDLEKYMQELKERNRERDRRSKIMKEENDKKEYERLKAKFEGVNDE
ncbi:hypothetical protein [Bacillus sp. Marseille-P3800]|uniref:hypothetical protein n=1 Tax=Bacillus sp. Marseille-P3800 TaxID=2014782 RepID=UPI000C07947D|nr:hypothetical protein [Bacillus sp. Marseille-P3800]